MAEPFNQSTFSITSPGYQKLLLYSHGATISDIDLSAISDGAIKDICNDPIACATLMINTSPNTIDTNRRVLQTLVCRSKFADEVLREGAISETSPWHEVCERNWWFRYWWAIVLGGFLICIGVMVLIVYLIKRNSRSPAQYNHNTSV